MSEYTKSELAAAHKAITSSVRKIEKAQATLSLKQTPPKAQMTLASRNLDALRLALSLIEREINDEKLIRDRNKP